MSKSKKILNYIAMACAIISAIIFFIDQNWLVALWTIATLIWIVNCHLAESSYYSQKEELAELTKDYFKLLCTREKEVKELKDEIEKISKGE